MHSWLKRQDVLLKIWELYFIPQQTREKLKLKNIFNLKNIAVIGTGVIGTGWILRFLANGIKVKAFDKNSQQLNFLKEK